jgi:hypothetical protein
MLMAQNLFPKPLVLALLCLALSSACGRGNTVNPRLSEQMPNKIIWAWERPEDLRFLDPSSYGVAFLAQTIYLENDNVTPRPRRQPLEIAPQTYIIAVTRIETNKETAKRPTFSTEMIRKTAGLIGGSISLPNVRAVQVDFDAVGSEREFYRAMIKELRRQLPAEAPLTMTSLASWCTGDAWFNDFPVDEAVPMAFQMGADESKIKNYLRNGNDWIEPLCRGSYGISVDDPLNTELKAGRRVYYFKNNSWNKSDLEKVE